MAIGEQSQLIFFDGILQTGQRFTMLTCLIEKGRVRGFPERLFSQSEELAEQDLTSGRLQYVLRVSGFGPHPVLK